jgi:hypothetical protein
MFFFAEALFVFKGGSKRVKTLFLTHNLSGEGVVVVVVGGKLCVCCK